MSFENFNFNFVFLIMPLNFSYLATCSDLDQACFYDGDQNIWKSLVVGPGQKKVGKHWSKVLCTCLY